MSTAILHLKTQNLPTRSLRFFLTSKYGHISYQHFFLVDGLIIHVFYDKRPCPYSKSAGDEPPVQIGHKKKSGD